ncbi:PREDICTED: granulins-like [Branchiostoma belcheri]|uniref:Granulins-like n=1 Tax=Branchiostoma belcheri TaxID=7741 RepID=A0A6P4YLE5_BRABE|nr:PREDICTED: granulins-like [Branchiostoma belcheri]
MDSGDAVPYQRLSAVATKSTAVLREQLVQVDVEKTPCPGGKQECPTNYTCCQRGATPYTWGCCDLPTAECCPDRKTCCPKGYHCDPSRATCYKSGSDEIVVAKQLTIPDTEQSQVSNIKCGSSNSTCGDSETCCKMASGQWGCCPMPKAVCCQDHLHCCPRGYTCDMPTSTCIRGNDILPMAQKRPADVFTKS